MASDGRPAQPKAILRGHKTQVHAAVFCRHNERLLTGDADGFVVAWDLSIMRPRAVWQAHANAILGIAGWGDERIITHGRDNKLIAWKLAEEDEAAMSVSLPLEPTSDPRPLPWMLHMLEVNTMNFCSFASCPVEAQLEGESELLLAVPNTLASAAIDIYHLPSQDRLHTVKLGEKNGMAMALSLFEQGRVLTLIAAYENGLATVAQLGAQGWTTTYQAKPHSQPILSLDVSPDKDFFVTSSADAILAKHPLSPAANHPTGTEIDESATKDAASGKTGEGEGQRTAGGASALSTALAAQARTAQPRDPTRVAVRTEPLRVVNTKHAGQQSLRIRSDGRVFATAGWDAKIRVYSNKTMKEVAVLKWHQVGCYAAAFSEVEAAGSCGGSSRPEEAGPGSDGGPKPEHEGLAEGQAGKEDGVLVSRLVNMTLKERRIAHARSTHWLAAGSKDGKVSLWDVF